MEHDDSLAPIDGGGDAAPAPQLPQVPMGQAMPDVQRIPTLLPQMQAVVPAADTAPTAASRVSTLGQGLSFVGTARVDGSLTVAGEVQGDIELAGSGSGYVTITQTGTVVGDIRARNISVLGQTVGTLDAAGGRVSLHDTASVSGRIRYTHLQVNGADLNAQLERVRPEGDGGQRA